jgi:hypothetical protein
MATVPLTRAASGRSDLAQCAETQDETRWDLSTRTEVDIVARVLCAVSTHTKLTEALLCFYATLDPTEARERTALVLNRMQKILPHDFSRDLSEACGYERPWAEDLSEGGPRSLAARVAMPAVYVIGMAMLALSVVGSITTIHYLLGR